MTANPHSSRSVKNPTANSSKFHSKAHQFWNSQLRSGATGDAERAWLDATENVVKRN